MGLIWGIPYLLIKVAVGEMTPSSLVLFRTAIGAAILLPVAAFRGDLRELRNHWPPILVYTVVEVALPWFLLADAERHLASSLTGLLIAAVPLIGAVLAWVTRAADRPDPRRVAGLIIGLAGVVALLGLGGSGHDPGAVAEVAVVSVCYAVGPMIIARRLSSVPAVGVVAVSLGLSALIHLPVGALQAPQHLPGPAVLAAVVGLGVICTALAFVVFFALIAEVGPVRATVITYVNPAVALSLGVALLGEPLTASALVGFALILVGSVVANRRPRAASAEPTAVAAA